jgi:hypothetical protein
MIFFWENFLKIGLVKFPKPKFGKIFPIVIRIYRVIILLFKYMFLDI